MICEIDRSKMPDYFKINNRTRSAAAAKHITARVVTGFLSDSVRHFKRNIPLIKSKSAKPPYSSVANKSKCINKHLLL